MDYAAVGIHKSDKAAQRKNRKMEVHHENQ